MLLDGLLDSEWLQSEASVSTTRGIFSSTECNKAFSISSLKFSNVFIDSESRGNNELLSRV